MLKIKTLIFISTILLQVSSNDETKSKKQKKKDKVAAEIAELKRMNNYYSEKVDHCFGMLDSMQQSQITCSKISDDNLNNFNKIFLENEKCNDSNLSLTNDNLQVKKNLQICETKQQSEEACSTISDTLEENVNKLTLENKKCSDTVGVLNEEKVELQTNLQTCEDKIPEMDDEICINIKFNNAGTGIRFWVRFSDSQHVFVTGETPVGSWKKCFKTKVTTVIYFIKLQQQFNDGDGQYLYMGDFYTSRKNGAKMYWKPHGWDSNKKGWGVDSDEDARLHGACAAAWNRFCTLEVYQVRI